MSKPKKTTSKLKHPLLGEKSRGKPSTRAVEVKGVQIKENLTQTLANDLVGPTDEMGERVTEGEQSLPFQNQTPTQDSRAATTVVVPSQMGKSAHVVTNCLGYTPSLTTGRCRCAVCKSKPLSERATRPFLSASDAVPTTSPSMEHTSDCVVSSPPKPPPKQETEHELPSS